MPDMERIIDKLRVDMAKIGFKSKGNSSEFWDGFSKGKSHARREVAIAALIVACIYIAWRMM